jgi:hypothetical protein
VDGVVVRGCSHPNKLIPLFLIEDVMRNSVFESCVPSLRLSIGRRSVGRGENMLDPEDMCQNTEEFTGEVGTVVAQENQRNSVVAYPTINQNVWRMYVPSDPV